MSILGRPIDGMVCWLLGEQVRGQSLGRSPLADSTSFWRNRMSAHSKSSSAAPLDGSNPPLGRRTVTIIEIFLVLLAIVVVWFAGKVLLMAFAGLLVAVFLSTLAQGLSRFMAISYGWSLVICVLLMAVLLASVIGLIGSHLASQTSEFVTAIPRSLMQIREDLSESSWGQWILEQSPEWGRAIARGNFPSRISDLASSLVDLFATLVIVTFVGLYCAAEPAVYCDGLLRLVPEQRRQRAREVFAALIYNLRWWLLGQLFAMACVGIITGIGMWLVGAPLALTLGLLAALLEIIPNIGPVLWLIPAALVALPQGPRYVVDVLVVYAVTHVLESYILIPLVQRRAVWLPPGLSILAAVLLGLWAGFLGLLVAAPITLVAMLLVKMLYVEDRLGDHDLRVPGENVA